MGWYYSKSSLRAMNKAHTITLSLTHTKKHCFFLFYFYFWYSSSSYTIASFTFLALPNFQPHLLKFLTLFLKKYKIYNPFFSTIYSSGFLLRFGLFFRFCCLLSGEKKTFYFLNSSRPPMYSMVLFFNTFLSFKISLTCTEMN